MSLFDTSYAGILKRMLDKVSAKFDKREGAVIYDALAPTAIEHQLIYMDMETLEREMFADTASREYLIKRASERGITPKEATPARWKATFDPPELNISIGERFNNDDMNLVVTGKLSPGVYELECETAGAAGNALAGSLLPMEYINGLRAATLTELLDAGTDEEDTEAFRDRYLEILRKPASSGNVNDYYNWAMSVTGVGAAKIYPLASGPGTVKVVIASADKKAASSTLVNEVQEYIDSVRPVGATVTVLSATELPVNITAKISIEQGENSASVQSKFQLAIIRYLAANAYETGSINLSMIGKILLDTEGVTDYSNLKLNGTAENVNLTEEQIAVIGTVTLEVVT